jgi:hypothetical protein
LISLDTFKVLASSLEQGADDRAVVADERRSASRIRCAGAMTIVRMEAGSNKPYSCQVHDLSFGGVCIAQGEPMTLGSRFILIGGSTGKRRAVLCSVSHSRREGVDATANTYLIGASFVREIDWHASRKPELLAPRIGRESQPPTAPDVFADATFEDPPQDM